MWSDTGSFEYKSPGDYFTSHNPDAFNLSGPTLPPVSYIQNKRINLIEN